MNNERVLVVGCNGQLGTDMCSEGRVRGCDVVGIDYPQIDIADRASVERCLENSGAAYVINCAAYTDVDGCETNRDRAFALNSVGAGYLASFSSTIGARMVHISTDYVFDGKKDGFYVESDTPNPGTVYGLSKLEGEREVASACMDHQIFRIAWLYGLHGKNFVFNVRALAAKRAATGEALTIVNDQLGTPTSTREVCRQVFRALQSDLTGVIHATCEGWCSWFDFSREVIRAAGIEVDLRPCTTAQFVRPAPRPANSRLENERLKQAGISIMTDWRSAFGEFLNDERAAGGNLCSK